WVLAKGLCLSPLAGGNCLLNAVPCYGLGRCPFLYSGVFFERLLDGPALLAYLGLHGSHDLFFEVIEVIELFSGTFFQRVAEVFERIVYFLARFGAFIRCK